MAPTVDAPGAVGKIMIPPRTGGTETEANHWTESASSDISQGCLFRQAKHLKLDKSIESVDRR